MIHIDAAQYGRRPGEPLLPIRVGHRTNHFDADEVAVGPRDVLQRPISLWDIRDVPYWRQSLTAVGFDKSKITGIMGDT
ncbi:hypothetical protein GTA56_04325 [Roseobacter sp. HKCCD8191]|nr:hypothetical protein [Roseobacter sp. HKCCD6265]NNY14446.1 hypothetical protein [Roseobacter sp. HKCCD8191]